MQLRLHSITYEAVGILSFELRSANGADLPAFTAGSHIDVSLPGGLTRSYSLVNPQCERHRYVIAVNKDAASRGGSRHMHENLQVGAILTISQPRNNFRLAEKAARSVFIAGGIGITPVLCMLDRLNALARPWTLYYCVRARQNAAFLERLRDLESAGFGSIHLNFDQGLASNMLDVPAAINAQPQGSHFYCCGPIPMLESFERACSGLPPDHVHVEYFAAKEAASVEGGFAVELARSGKTVSVPRGMTILDALLEAGMHPKYSCMEGICGTCEVKVISGIPDHKDLVLTAQERTSNQVMMICCSGSKSDRLVIDF